MAAMSVNLITAGRVFFLFATASTLATKWGIIKYIRTRNKRVLCHVCLRITSLNFSTCSAVRGSCTCPIPVQTENSIALYPTAQCFHIQILTVTFIYLLYCFVNQKVFFKFRDFV